MRFVVFVHGTPNEKNIDDHHHVENRFLVWPAYW